MVCADWTAPTQDASALLAELPGPHLVALTRWLHRVTPKRTQLAESEEELETMSQIIAGFQAVKKSRYEAASVEELIQQHSLKETMEKFQKKTGKSALTRRRCALRCQQWLVAAKKPRRRRNSSKSLNEDNRGTTEK